MAKIKAERIWLKRGEGLIEECNEEFRVCSFREADAILRQWAETAPYGGGYDKCDFSVTFTDLEVYEGRFDLTREDKDRWTSLLAQHIRDHVTFCAGLRRPAHLSPEQYQRYLENEDTTEYLRFLSDYQIGDES